MLGVVAVGAAAVVVYVVLRVGGGAPEPGIEGLPDAGPVTGWGLPLLRVGADLCAAGTLGALVVGVVLCPVPGAGRAAVDAVRCVRVAGGWALGWALCSAAGYVLTISSFMALPPAQVLGSAEFLGLGVMFSEGKVLLVTLALAAVVAAGARVPVTRGRGLALLAVALGAILPVAFVGHAASADNHDIAASALMTHLVAVAIWVGGLAAVLACLRDSELLGVVLPRFSTLALGCFAAVAVSGVASAWVRMGPADNLWDTGYGRFVLVKTAVLVALGAFGHAHRRRTVRFAGDRGRRRTFARLAAGEIVLMAAAIGLAVGLSRTPPPTDGGHAHALLDYTVAPFTAGGLVTGVRVDPLILLLLAGLALGYLAGLRRVARAGGRWPAGRVAAWYAGVLLLALVLMGGVAAYSRVMMTAHVLQFVTLTVVAPLLLAAGAPVTLAVRALSPASQYGEAGRAFLDGALARRLTHPGGLPAAYGVGFALLYGTGWFERSLAYHAVHLATQGAFLLAGLAAFWVLTGADPLPRPVPWAARMWLLAGVAAAHLAVAALLMAGPQLAGTWLPLVTPPGAPPPLEDQRLAGALLATLAAVPLAALAVLLTLQRRLASARRARPGA
ncbi:putative copper resistance protein D [Thermocatellispora tengchongensis]|uniref:Putative copper resistance protein D n=1 Tax=Thermocatellispora tengchongensis TaxID=1073253 RepID=A0A840PM75_9ACTN|nr:cytochrome c oxidase assembly protein [Thermocatellispora tengchongensis]MBB5139103.1 putative copper resistance protein D [Thermocatellispora tengchongensis]